MTKGTERFGDSKPFGWLKKPPGVGWLIGVIYCYIILLNQKTC